MMTRKKLQALCVILFPIILTIGILLIPVVPNYADHDMAERAAGQTGRWFFGHIICAVAFGIGILSAQSIVERLADRSVPGWRIVCVPLMAIGGALYAAGLGADGIGPLATAAAGERAGLFFDGSGVWVTGVFMAGSMLFGVGLVLQVIIVFRSKIIEGKSRPLLFFAALIFLLAPTIPSGWGLYAVAASALVIYLPTGLVLWRDTAD